MTPVFEVKPKGDALLITVTVGEAKASTILSNVQMLVEPSPPNLVARALERLAEGLRDA